MSKVEEGDGKNAGLNKKLKELQVKYTLKFNSKRI
jgi:hypothetical protein